MSRITSHPDSFDSQEDSLEVSIDPPQSVLESVRSPSYQFPKPPSRFLSRLISRYCHSTSLYQFAFPSNSYSALQCTLTKLRGVNTLPRSGALGANTVCCKLFVTSVIMFFVQWETCLCWSLAYSLDYACTMPRLSHPLSTPLIMLIRTSIEHHSYYRYKIYSYEMPPCMSHRV